MEAEKSHEKKAKEFDQILHDLAQKIRVVASTARVLAMATDSNVFFEPDHFEDEDVYCVSSLIAESTDRIAVDLTNLAWDLEKYDIVKKPPEPAKERTESKTEKETRKRYGKMTFEEKKKVFLEALENEAEAPSLVDLGLAYLTNLKQREEEASTV